MADIRIKDLTTTASTTAADDFFAADGATNGTRKLSAYSPSFGGNATVGGNLTANGGGTHLFGGTTRVSTANGTAATVSLLQAAQQQWAVEIPASSTNLRLRAVDAGVDALTLGTNGSGTFAGAVGISSTTASTTTSSGALVVGNGTSGGLGVAGNTNIGGALRFHTNTALPGTASISKDATFGLNFYASTGSTYDFTIFNAAGTGLLVNPTGTSALTAFDTFTATGTLIANAASNAFRITTAQTPASAAATGTAGTIAWDSSYIYVCTATNTWKRVAIATW
jgi:hypothetical protein